MAARGARVEEPRSLEPVAEGLAEEAEAHEAAVEEQNTRPVRGSKPSPAWRLRGLDGGRTRWAAVLLSAGALFNVGVLLAVVVAGLLAVAVPLRARVGPPAARQEAHAQVTATATPLPSPTPRPSFQPLDLAGYVDPFVGTQSGVRDYGFGGSAGNTFPGATLPFGMVQWGPDTTPGGIAHPGGYAYPDGRIERFSLTHMSGAGCTIFGDIPFMPTPQTVADAPSADPGRYSAPFAHGDEHAAPGFYGVTLGSGVQVELTATARTGLARVRYPAGRPQTLLLESGADLRGIVAAHAEFVSPTEIRGSVTGGPFCAYLPTTYTVYFDAQFSAPAAQLGAWGWGGVAPGARRADGGGSGLYAQFGPDAGDTLLVKVGLSYVSTDNAAANLAAEDPGWDFDGVKAAASATWNALLNRVQATGGSDGDERTFYTALYHSLLAPNTFSDANGQYRGFDDQVHTVAAGHAQYANFSGWDIYRSEIPLISLLAPQQAADMMQSLVNDGTEAGALPRWPLANGETGIMVGDPPAAILAEGEAYGAGAFDTAAALRLALAGATKPGIGAGGSLERPGLEAYLAKGYIPVSGGAYAPVSTSLEYYAEDYAIACLARDLGDDASARQFTARAAGWANFYNPATGYLQPRNWDGSFYGGGNPASDDQFVEGNAAQYTWMVPFDVGGLVAHMGGPDQAQRRLDAFFSQFAYGPDAPYAWMGNEPSFGTPWAYDYMGAPWKTQATVRRVMTQFYGDSPRGLPGNDDLGAMSSWYVWSALGMYPLLPGRAGFVLGSPLFPNVTLTLADHHIAIAAQGAGRDAPYVQELRLDGMPSSRLWLPLATLEDTGELRFTMGNTPNQAWGTAPTDAPPSLSTER